MHIISKTNSVYNNICMELKKNIEIEIFVDSELMKSEKNTCFTWERAVSFNSK